MPRRCLARFLSPCTVSVAVRHADVPKSLNRYSGGKGAMSIRTILVLSFIAISSQGFAQGNAENDAAANESQQILKALHWVKGSQSVSLFGVASVDVPAGYGFLNPNDTEKFMTLAQNPSSGTQYLLGRREVQAVRVANVHCRGLRGRRRERARRPR